MGVSWDEPQAKSAIQTIYLRLLDRIPDSGGLNAHVNFLVQQNRTMQTVVENMGSSLEYYQKWVEPSMGPQLWGTPITGYYRHFLNRLPESTQVLHSHASIYVSLRRDMFAAHRQLVQTFVRSNEYNQKWGHQGVPGLGAVPMKDGVSPGGSQGNRQWEVCLATIGGHGTTYSTHRVWGQSSVDAARQFENKLRQQPPGHTATSYEVSAGPCP